MKKWMFLKLMVMLLIGKYLMAMYRRANTTAQERETLENTLVQSWIF